MSASEKLSRRRLLGTAGGRTFGGFLFARAPELAADPPRAADRLPVFPVREQLANDFEGKLRRLAGMGYQVIKRRLLRRTSRARLHLR